MKKKWLKSAIVVALIVTTVCMYSMNGIAADVADSSSSTTTETSQSTDQATANTQSTDQATADSTAIDSTAASNAKNVRSLAREKR